MINKLQSFSSNLDILNNFIAESVLSNEKECQDVPKFYMDEKGTWQRSQILMGYDDRGIRWISFSFRAVCSAFQSDGRLLK